MSMKMRKGKIINPMNVYPFSVVSVVCLLLSQVVQCFIHGDLEVCSVCMILDLSFY